MSYNIISSSPFEKSLKGLKKYPSLREDLASLIIELKNNPFAGDAIGKDCYKIRMAISSKGKGKREEQG